MKAEKVYETFDPPKFSTFDFVALIVLMFWPPILFGLFWLVYEYGEVIDYIGTVMFNNPVSAFLIFAIVSYLIYLKVRK